MVAIFERTALLFLELALVLFDPAFRALAQPVGQGEQEARHHEDEMNSDEPHEVAVVEVLVEIHEGL